MVTDLMADVLIDITVDTFHFRVTPAPWHAQACVVWFRRTDARSSFETLGQFSCFDRRSILEFVTRYSTNQRLRQEIEKRKFERRVQNLSQSYFESIAGMRTWQKSVAYRSLFNLDSAIEQPSLDTKRRIMARRFHPDMGGDNRCMTYVNEAFDYLAARA